MRFRLKEHTNIPRLLNISTKGQPINIPKPRDSSSKNRNCLPVSSFRATIHTKIYYAYTVITINTLYISSLTSVRSCSRFQGADPAPRIYRHRGSHFQFNLLKARQKVIRYFTGDGSTVRPQPRPTTVTR